MQTFDGRNVDLYIPRKCSWTNRLITAKEHGAVQINIGEVDAATGKYTGKFKTFALSSAVRTKGEADMAINTLIARADLVEA
eukprot:CAMPEP_0116841416 /NCGR_PEP_ID=MMETSP0418-20121206/10912_1 /TAXON_ID=1158023 /ORGANISM="Astrosyne radiata, Strain 13vi08-1A" /LENGTH=81 /DNA_ID=CAMNT_0004471839 /DNA_START=43 /DNA_END=288 /DNA_ORIENTATION=-